MRRLVAGMLVLLFGLASVAGGAPGKPVKEVASLVKEIEGKVIKRANTNINVKATGCGLCIEFQPQSVTFVLPLEGATVAESDLDDSLVITNARMTRTIPSRSTEYFERLTLRFGKHNLGPMKTVFERAIQACRI